MAEILVSDIAPAARGEGLAQAALRAAKILVVDDLAADRRFIKDILEAAGWASVTATGDAAEVRELHLQHRFDLVILDAQMPGIDGFEVMRQLREADPGYLPILMVTAEPGHMERALHSGARDFVCKPFRVPELVARARNLLEARIAWKEAHRLEHTLRRELDERTADLRRSQEIFRLFASQIPEALWIRSVGDDTIVYVNPSWERITGQAVAAGERVEAMLRCVHPEDLQRIRTLRALHPRGGIQADVRFLRADGEVRHGRARTFPLRDAHGEPRWVAGILEDVTERERSEAMLREADSKFRALVEQSVTAIYVSEDWRFTYANPRLCEMLGYSAGELWGRDPRDFVVEEDRPRMLENRARALAGEAAALGATYRLRRRDGAIVHVEVGGRFVELGGRRVLLGFAQDHTERVLAEQRRLEAEAQYAAVVEQSLIGVYIRDNERLRYASPRLCEILGRDPATMKDLRLAEHVIPEDHGILKVALERRAAGDTGPVRLTCRVRRGDGEIRHVDVESKVVEIGGRQEIMGLVQDVTERELAAAALRLSEEKYRVLWETSTDAIVLLRDEGLIEYANPSVRQVFGYAPEELEGRHIRILQPRRLREAHEDGVRRYLETGERNVSWRSTEQVALHADGHEFPVEISFSEMLVGGRKLFAAFMRDISERKAAHAALEQAVKGMEALSERILDIQEEERRALSLELHDDIGQALVALRIGLHRLGAALREEDAGLLAECDRVAGMVQERVREMAQQLHPPQLEQLGLRDALLWLVEHQRQITAIDIGCSFRGLEAGERLPASLESACFRICQEALNNATRHAHARSIRIEVDLHGNVLQLHVTDDGVGFVPESERRKASRRGSLGLIGMEQRARRAGGRLEILSRKGMGTQVIVFFDLERQ